MHKLLSLSLLLSFFICAVPGCGSGEQGESRRAPVQVSLAVAANPYSGLIAIAESKGFFEKCGLDLSAKIVPSGLSAVEAVIRGEAQLATAADFVMAAKVFDEPTLRVIASIGTSGASEIVARKDRKIRRPSDLKGKRIGFSRGTTAEYYLDAFLLANGIGSQEVDPVDIPPARIVDAIASGEVDAISSWDVYVHAAEKRLGENAAHWPAQNYLDYYWLLVAKEGVTLAPEPIKRFLRALTMAENFLLANEQEAKKILTRKWKLEPDFIDGVWAKTRLTVTLNQSMLASLESFARWRLRKEGRTEILPNYLQYIYSGALDEVESRAVTLFR